MTKDKSIDNARQSYVLGFASNTNFQLDWVFEDVRTFRRVLGADSSDTGDCHHRMLGIKDYP